MTPLATLLERPLWELAFGATSLVAACVVGALIFFWIGFRIVDVPAAIGFEGMFSRPGHADTGYDREISAEAAALFQTLEDRRRSLAEQSSLEDLAAATRSFNPPPSGARGYAQQSKSGETGGRF